MLVRREPTGDQMKAMIAERLGMTVEELSAMGAERIRNAGGAQMWLMAKYAAQATPATAQ